MRRGRLEESDAVTLTAIVAALLINEIKFYQEDATDPTWIGVVTLFFHSLSYFSLLATITIDILLVFLWTTRERSLEAVVAPPSFFLLLGLFAYFLQLAFGVVIDIFVLRIDEKKGNFTALYVAYAIPQYVFYIFVLVYGWFMTVLWYQTSRDRVPASKVIGRKESRTIVLARTRR